MRTTQTAYIQTNMKKYSIANLPKTRYMYLIIYDATLSDIVRAKKVQRFTTKQDIPFIDVPYDTFSLGIFRKFHFFF